MIERQDINTIEYIGLIGYRFKIIKAYKGELKNEVTIITIAQSSACGIIFHSNEKYLIYASVDKKGEYYTDQCTRTGETTNRELDIGILEKILTSSFQTCVSGKVMISYKVYNTVPYSFKKVRLYNTRYSYETETDSIGIFIFSNLPVDSFNVEIETPETHQAEDLRPINLHQDSIAEVVYKLIPNSKIIGKITDQYRNPISKTWISIQPTSETSHDESDESWRSYLLYKRVLTSDSGRFEFKNIYPGDYILGNNLNSPPDGDRPFPKTYYPGVYEESLATVIHIGLGEIKTDINMSIDSILQTCKVSGHVKYSNGNVMQKGYLHLYNSDNRTEFVGAIEVDTGGHFEFRVIKNIDIWLEATSYYNDPNSNRKEIKQFFFFNRFNEDSDNINLTIQLPSK